MKRPVARRAAGAVVVCNAVLCTLGFGVAVAWAGCVSVGFSGVATGSSTGLSLSSTAGSSTGVGVNAGVSSFGCASVAVGVVLTGFANAPVTV